MLYLEDYLEMIEHLPAELRDRFTEMRTSDLEVQNKVDVLAAKEKAFFASCKRLKASERNDEYEKIRREYAEVIGQSSEKIQNAEECYNLVDRYLRKLDQELHKFKMELEADNSGITEILERRSLEMDAPAASTGTAKENRLPKKQQTRKANQTIAHTPSATGINVGGMPKAERNRGGSMPAGYSAEAIMQGLDPNLSASSPISLPSIATPSTSGMGLSTYPLQHMGTGGNALAAAASQAIAATQQLVPGRRTSSLKASYEAIHLGVQSHEFQIGRELAGATQSALAASGLLGGGADSPIPSTSSGQPSTKRQKTNKRGYSIDPGTPQPAMLDVVSGVGSGSGMDGADGLMESLGGSESSPSAEDILGGGRDGDEGWNYDPSEPRYCICNQVSYGDMVACDNVDCPYEWFHYPCVGITAPPKGKWYCPTCSARRKGRK